MINLLGARWTVFSASVPSCLSASEVKSLVSRRLLRQLTSPFKMLLEAFITEYAGRAESSGQELPLGIESPKARLEQRAQMAANNCTSLEEILRYATEAANIAANDHAGLLSRK